MPRKFLLLVQESPYPPHAFSEPSQRIPNLYECAGNEGRQMQFHYGLPTYQQSVRLLPLRVHNFQSGVADASHQQEHSLAMFLLTKRIRKLKGLMHK